MTLKNVCLNIWCVIINSTKLMQHFGIMGISGIYYNCLFNFTHPPILSALLPILSASRFLVPEFSGVGARAFSVLGPSTWNSLPLPLQQKPTLVFKSNCMTFLFPKTINLPCFSIPFCCLPLPQASIVR